MTTVDDGGAAPGLRALSNDRAGTRLMLFDKKHTSTIRVLSRRRLWSMVKSATTHCYPQQVNNGQEQSCFTHEDLGFLQKSWAAPVLNAEAA